MRAAEDSYLLKCKALLIEKYLPQFGGAAFSIFRVQMVQER
jgi:hypothetical protein